MSKDYEGRDWKFESTQQARLDSLHSLPNGEFKSDKEFVDMVLTEKDAAKAPKSVMISPEVNGKRTIVTNEAQADKKDGKPLRAWALGNQLVGMSKAYQGRD